MMVTMIYSIKYLPISIVSLVMNTTPLIVALFGFIILHEHLTKGQMVCLLIAFLGVSAFFITKAPSGNKNATDPEAETY